MKLKCLGRRPNESTRIRAKHVNNRIKGAKKDVYGLLALMFALFVAGLSCVVIAGM